MRGQDPEGDGKPGIGPNLGPEFYPLAKMPRATIARFSKHRFSYCI